MLLERDSPRDQLVVTVFLLIVFGLLLGAGIKSRMEKAGLDVSNWNNGLQAWWVKRMPVENFSLSRLGNRTARNDTRGEYVSVDNA